MLSGLSNGHMVCHTRCMRTPSPNRYKNHRLPAEKHGFHLAPESHGQPMILPREVQLLRAYVSDKDVYLLVREARLTESLQGRTELIVRIKEGDDTIDGAKDLACRVRVGVDLSHG